MAMYQAIGLNVGLRMVDVAQWVDWLDQALCR